MHRSKIISCHVSSFCVNQSKLIYTHKSNQKSTLTKAVSDHSPGWHQNLRMWPVRSEYENDGGVTAVEVLCPLKDGDFNYAIGLSG